MIITKEGDHLVANVVGQGTFELLFQSEKTVSFKGIAGAGGQFVIENGKVSKLIVQQNGQYVWRKIK